MIKRVWHGWTTIENADAYQTILFNEVIPIIDAKNVSGYRGIEVMRRLLEDEVEFVTIMSFDSLQNVIEFQGEDYARAHVPDVAQKVLKRWDQTAAHYDIVAGE
ncbi:hypothetical protein N9M10_02775 [Hellea sp.]|nr:hypothetical protein [Hellea sp.]